LWRVDPGRGGQCGRLRVLALEALRMSLERGIEGGLAGDAHRVGMTVVTGVLPAELSFLGWTPATVTVPLPVRQLNPATVVDVLTAIRRRVRLKVVYQSMSSPEPSQRMLAPHGVAFDGFRWHVRAYCDMRHEFRDFVLARMLEVEVVEEPGTDGAGTASGWS